MKLLEAKPIVDKLTKSLAKKFQGKSAQLVIFSLTNDPASEKFVSLKQKLGAKLGVKVMVETTLDKFELYNQDPATTGVMIQLPVPIDVHQDNLLLSINPLKDCDGLNKKSGVQPAVVVAILKLLHHYKVELTGKNIVVLNDSSLIGRPLARTLFPYTKDIAICNKFTPNLKIITKSADVLITATGVAHLIDKDWVRQGAVVIDAGYPGDVDANSLKDTVSAISPVPGGVGPVTVVSLFENLSKLAKK